MAKIAMSAMQTREIFLNTPLGDTCLKVSARLLPHLSQIPIDYLLVLGLASGPPVRRDHIVDAGVAAGAGTPLFKRVTGMPLGLAIFGRVSNGIETV